MHRKFHQECFICQVIAYPLSHSLISVKSPMEPQLAANRSVYLVLLSRWLTNKVMILHFSSSKIAKKVWILARTLANPLALPTILHSKGRITYLPLFSEILGAQTMILTWTSPDCHCTADEHKHSLSDSMTSTDPAVP